MPRDALQFGEHDCKKMCVCSFKCVSHFPKSISKELLKEFLNQRNINIYPLNEHLDKTDKPKVEFNGLNVFFFSLSSFWCVFLCGVAENVHQLDFHIGAQMAHHRAGERRPFGLRAKLLQHSCNDASSRCRSETNLCLGLRKKLWAGGVGGVSHTLIF